MPHKNDELLEKAIARNVSAVLSLPSAGNFRNHKTRFICTTAEGIVMEAPDGDRPLVAELSRTHRPCGVSFKSGMYKVSFAVGIIRIEIKWKLNESMTVQALLLEFPKRVQVTQKRSDYRVEIQSGTDIGVRVWRLAINEELPNLPASTKEIIAKLTNLSTGGIGVQLSGSDGRRPKVCTEDRLRILLTFEGEEVLLEGRMRPPHIQLEGNTVFTGMQFKKSSMEPKTAAKLLKIFVELQRRELRANKLGMRNSA